MKLSLQPTTNTRLAITVTSDTYSFTHRQNGNRIAMDGIILNVTIEKTDQKNEKEIQTEVRTNLIKSIEGCTLTHKVNGTETYSIKQRLVDMLVSLSDVFSLNRDAQNNAIEIKGLFNLKVTVINY